LLSTELSWNVFERHVCHIPDRDGLLASERKLIALKRADFCRWRVQVAHLHGKPTIAFGECSYSAPLSQSLHIGSQFVP